MKLLLLALLLSPGDDPTQDSLAQAADGAPVCGLGADFHAGRRALLRERVPRGVVVLRGLPETRDWTEFRQDVVFWYLTGVETPGAALVMDLASGREVLFLPAGTADLKRSEDWEGELWDSADEWVSELTGIAEVRPAGELLEVLDELMEAEGALLWTSLAPHVAQAGSRDRAAPYVRARSRLVRPSSGSRSRALASALQERYEILPADLTLHLDEMRRVKTPEELAALRRAAHAGVLAMEEAMRSTRPGLGEWELDALMTWVQWREGAAGPAYYAIVGSGPNSLVLHYNASRRRMRDGEVVLIDFGPAVDHYTTDITRTWPVNGTFSERQAELYDAVLEAQQAGIAAVRPGATLGDVENACRRALASHRLAHLMPHGATHYLGLEVHDVGSRSTRLQPGVVFTIEPGVYEPETGIGIRIEDVVAVTEDGCEVLTAGVPKDREAVEALVRSEGLLDRLAAGGR